MDFEEIKGDIINLLEEKGFTIKEWFGGGKNKSKNNIFKEYRALRKDINIFILIKEIE